MGSLEKGRFRLNVFIQLSSGINAEIKKNQNTMVYIEVEYTEIDDGLLLWRMMLQNHLKYYKIKAKM